MQIENLTDLINKTNIRAFVTTNDFIKGKQYDKNKITLKSEKEKIEKMLIRDNLLIEDIYYAMYENNKLFIIRKDELK